MAQQQTMERANSATIPPPEQESLTAHLARSTKNTVYSCFGCLQTSKEKTLIKYKEYEIEQRKKTFGVSYINFKRQGQDEKLPECVEAALKDITSFESEIQELRTKITEKENETKSRLVPAPGTPMATATTPKPIATTPTTAQPPETALAPPAELDVPASDVTDPAPANSATV